MTLTAPLQIRDVTAHIRGDDPRRPVQVGYDGTRIIMALDTEAAGFLARLLANVNTTADVDVSANSSNWQYLVEKADQDTWVHAMIDILASIAEVHGNPVPHTLGRHLGVVSQ